MLYSMLQHMLSLLAVLAQTFPVFPGSIEDNVLPTLMPAFVLEDRCCCW